MTSDERKELRYQRRKDKRIKKKNDKYSYCDNFDKVFSYENLYQAYQICRKGVSWKASVQKYIIQAPYEVYKTYKNLHEGKYKPEGFYEFDIMERGKLRHICSVTINERVVQRCLCDNALVPMLKRSFIYDNGACMQDKGYTFAINRLTMHLQKHFRKYGNEGYILIFDFKKFYDNISHELIKSIVNKNFSDEKIKNLCYQFIDAFGDVGLGLGSQVSQILALSSANQIDHLVKEKLCIQGYGRYNDDGYLISSSKEYLKECLNKIKILCKELDIIINEKKTHIIKLSHGFTWLKVKFYLTKTGRVIKKINSKSITRTRRKLKKLKQLLDDNKIEYQDVQCSWQSWRAYAKNFNSNRTIFNTAKLYNKLFITDWLCKPMVSEKGYNTW